MIPTNTPKQPSIETRYREVMNDEEFELMQAYIAGVIDSTSSLTVRVGKEKSAYVGYTITPMLSLRRRQEHLIGVFDNWCLEHGISANLREKEPSGGTEYVLEVARRDDLRTLLEQIRPFVIVKHDVVEIMLHEILPRLEDGKASTKEGFIETMEYVDMIKEANSGSSKYSKEYFENEWAAET